MRLAAEAACEVTREPFRVRMGRDDVSAEIEGLRGRRGRVRVMKLRYPGFEPVDRLVPVVVLEGGAESLEPSITLRLLQGSLEPVAELETRVSDAEMDEAVEEALFLDEHEVSRLEQGLFERAMGQLERFIEDRVLISEAQPRRARAADCGRPPRSRRRGGLGRAHSGRVAAPAIGARARGARGELDRLSARDDEGYRRWRQHAYERRYAPPERQSILNAEFVIG